MSLLGVKGAWNQQNGFDDAKLADVLYASKTKQFMAVENTLMRHCMEARYSQLTAYV